VNKTVEELARRIGAVVAGNTVHDALAATMTVVEYAIKYGRKCTTLEAL
jgi:hypothetical protein